MKIKIQRKHIELLIIIILGFSPLLWFQDGKIILGHDAGLTLSPLSHFLDRLYTWTLRFGFGNDQSYAIPGFFIHGFEGLIYLISNSVQQTQKIVFIFWFVLPGLSMYYFIRRLEKKLEVTYMALPAALLYMFNHFILQGWFIAERSKFSLYIAAPLMMALLFDWKDRKKSTLITSISLSLLFFVFNGLASLPLFGGIIVLIVVFFSVYIIEGHKNSIKRLIRLLFSTILFSVGLHAYWLLPFGNYVSNSYSKSVTFFGGVEGILDWIKYVSGNSSYINLLRLQGVPEWYQNPLHPYAQYFLTNPVLILVSLLFPIAAFGSLIFAKKKYARKFVLFFALTALLSVVMAAGSHPPLGFIYLFLVKYVPGFIAFRTPFYKFSSSLWFSYSVLVGFSIGFIMQKFKMRKIPMYFLYITICAGLVLYSYPFLTGSFFDYIRGERSMRVHVPDYVYEYGKWSEDSSRIKKRTIMLPPPNLDSTIEAYRWGYWSLAPLTSLLSNAPIVNVSAFTAKDEKSMLSQLFVLMKKNDPDWIKLARLMNIQTIVLRNDFDWKLNNSPTDSPAEYRALLNDKKNVSMVKKFGEWSVYDINSYQTKDANSASGISYVQGGVENLSAILTIPEYKKRQPLFFSGQSEDQISKAVALSTEFYIPARCIMCTMQWSFVNNLAYTPTLTRSSFLYPFISYKVEQEEKRVDSNPSAYLHFLSYRSLTQVLGMQRIIDQKIKIKALKETHNDYLYTMDKIKKLLESQMQNLDNKTILELLSVLRTNNVVMIQILDQLPQKKPGNYKLEITSFVNAMRRKSNEIRTNAETKVWRTMDEREKRLLVDIPVAGTYEMFYRPNKAISDEKSVVYEINGETFNSDSILNNSGWNDLGTHNLNQGENKIQISHSPSLLYESQDNIILAGGSNGCFTSPLFESKRDDIYNLNFKHKNSGPNSTFFVAFLEKDGKLDPDIQIKLTSYRTVKDYQNTYASNSDKGFRFIICKMKSDLENKERSEIEISDLQFQKMDIPDIIFYRSENKNIGYTDNTLQKMDQTKYVGSATMDSNVLILNQSYNNNWGINGQNTHFLADGYSNGWFIEEPKNQYVISYALQNLFYAGSVVSIISFAGLAWILIRNKKNDRKNK